MLTRLLQFVLQLFFGPIPLTIPQRKSSVPPAQSPFDGEQISIEYDGMVLTFGTIEIPDLWTDEISGTPIDSVLDEETSLFWPIHNEATPMYYRDEDGELRPMRDDRRSLFDLPLEEIAAEYLRAKSDAEAMSDLLEREITSALRDAYNRELWRRATFDGVQKVAVGGRYYELVPFPVTCYVHLLAIE